MVGKERRRKHNSALTAFNGLIDFAKKIGIKPIYEGETLTEEEIESHDNSKYDTRTEMTNAFLKVLNELGEYSAIDCPHKDAKKELMDLQKRMDKVRRTYGIKKELQYDDGDIEFEDSKDFYR